MKPVNKTAHHWRQSRFGAGSIAAMCLVQILGAALGHLDTNVAIESSAALCAIGGIAYALSRSESASRIPVADFVFGQLCAVFALLAWLTFRAGAAPAAVIVPYLVAMLYGTLQLDRARLAIAAVVAAVLHGTALFMLADDGRLADAPAAWTQFGALVLAFAWFTFTAGVVQRLRARLSDAHRRLHDLERDANERASRDTLTGVYHHRHLMDALEREIARAERVGKPLSIARVDLDWLGSVNQTHGAVAGDIALKRFTDAASGALRDVDIFGRYGGKEFLALMPDTDLHGAVIAAERIRAAVGRESVPEVLGRRNLSCTLGVAEHRKGENTRLVIARAEAGLNYAKAAGRDRVVALQADGRPAGVETR